MFGYIRHISSHNSFHLCKLKDYCGTGSLYFKRCLGLNLQGRIIGQGFGKELQVREQCGENWAIICYTGYYQLSLGSHFLDSEISLG